jgi:putative component of toxin-antitoxin plasmid stabilization module
MITVLETEVFESWLKRLKDPRGKARIIHRIRALERGSSVQLNWQNIWSPAESWLKPKRFP